MNTDICKILR